MEEPTCEICGRKGVKAVVFVEGAKLAVCGGCAWGKKVLHFFEEEGPKTSDTEAPHAKTEESEEIVDGFGKKIKKARERAGLPVSVVAERISERQSYLERIEREEIEPTFAVAKKLEKELNIKLIEKVAASVAPTAKASKKFSEPTLGDMLEGEGKKGE